MSRFFKVCWDCPRYSLQKWYIWASFQFFSSHQLLISNLLCYSIYLNEKYSIWISFEFSNKNILTGPVKCKKTTRHHAHLSLCAKSRKTNDAKSRKWSKTSIWAIFGRFRGQISPNCKFFWKKVSFKLKVIFSTNFRPKTKKINWAVFEKYIKVSDFGLIWRRFAIISKSRGFFKNLAVWLFYLYSPLTSCKKSEESLGLFLRKLRYQPTNQPKRLIWG